MKNHILKIAGVLGLAFISLTSCTNNKQAPLVYFPDMYFPVAYDPLMKDQSFYSNKVNELPPFVANDGQTALPSVEGTVAQNEDGVLPIDLPKNQQEYNAFFNESLTITQSPLDPKNKAKDIARGKILFDRTCGACHGEHGDGQGPIVESGAYAGVPNYANLELSVGAVHYVLVNGRNNMGSYAGQFTPGDRWRVAMYVMDEFKDKPAKAAAVKASAQPTQSGDNTTTK